MSVLPIRFFFEGVPASLKERKRLKSWIHEVVFQEGRNIQSLLFIFCDDAYLSRINHDFLQHDTLTDVITFDLRDNTDQDSALEGEIYISWERVKDNAAGFRVPFGEELRRVMVHGTLHLLGYVDKTAAQKRQMREREDFYLPLF